MRERVEAADALELTAPASLGVICFRRRFPGAANEDEVDAHNAALVVALEQSGLGLVSSTIVNGRYTLRVCVLNHTTGADDVDRLMDFLQSAEPTTLAAPAAAGTVALAGACQRDHPIPATPLRRRSNGGGG